MFYIRANEAVSINAPTGSDMHVTEHGSDWLFSAFSVMALFVVGYLLLTWFKKEKRYAFVYNNLASLLLIMYLYFIMASDLGWAPVQAEFNHVTVENSSATPGLRQVFYSRYVAWFLAWPFQIANLALLARLDWPIIFMNFISTEVYVISLLVACVVHSTYKWGFFTFAIAGFIVTLINLYTSGLKSATEVGSDVRGAYIKSLSILSFFWLLYPICFGLSEGGNVIQPDSEAVFYGVLDVCLFLIYPIIFLFFTKGISLERLNLRAYLNYEGPNERHLDEKESPALEAGTESVQPETTV